MGRLRGHFAALTITAATAAVAEGHMAIFIHISDGAAATGLW